MKKIFGIVNDDNAVIEVGTGNNISALFRDVMIKAAKDGGKALSFDPNTGRARQVELSEVPTEPAATKVEVVEDADPILALIKTSADIKPRDLEMSDIKWKYLVRSAVRGKNIMMVGPAGCGKTQAAHPMLVYHELPVSGNPFSSHDSGTFGYQRVGDDAKLPSNHSTATFMPSWVLSAYGRIWCGGISGDTQTVYFSDLLAGTDFLNGFTYICGLDPAMIGDTAAICYAIDRSTSKRYIVDAIKISRPSPADIRNLIFDWTSLYSPSEWIVEKNAFQSFLTQDEGIRMHLAQTRSKNCSPLSY